MTPPSEPPPEFRRESPSGLHTIPPWALEQPQAINEKTGVSLGLLLTLGGVLLTLAVGGIAQAAIALSKVSEHDKLLEKLQTGQQLLQLEQQRQRDAHEYLKDTLSRKGRP